MSIKTRRELEKIEIDVLAPYAIKSAESQGRLYPENKHPYRTEFQRDRDRIVHSTAFRRLQYKTQVFVNHEGDHYRTRLTHTKEVASVARSISRVLGLNEDLTEGVALAHDLGHTPFGHSGEEALNRLMADHGGFEHNMQCIRVVDLLETRYPDFPGLNLTFELREGILKHHSDYDHPDIPLDLQSDIGSSLECQVVNMADEIAYNCHDVDDGLYSGLITEEQLQNIAICRRHLDLINRDNPEYDEMTRKHLMVRRLIDEFVTDLVNNTSVNIKKSKIKTANDVRDGKLKLIQFSEYITADSKELKQFLYKNLYKHERLIKAADDAKQIVATLYKHFTAMPEVLPESYYNRLKKEPLEIVVADYIAGMTDRFAGSEYEKLTGEKVQ
jgi:dGTPase